MLRAVLPMIVVLSSSTAKRRRKKALDLHYCIRDVDFARPIFPRVSYRARARETFS